MAPIHLWNQISSIIPIPLPTYYNTYSCNSVFLFFTLNDTKWSVWAGVPPPNGSSTNPSSFINLSKDLLRGDTHEATRADTGECISPDEWLGNLCNFQEKENKNKATVTEGRIDSRGILAIWPRQRTYEYNLPDSLAAEEHMLGYHSDRILKDSRSVEWPHKMCVNDSFCRRQDIGFMFNSHMLLVVYLSAV